MSPPTANAACTRDIVVDAHPAVERRFDRPFSGTLRLSPSWSVAAEQLPFLSSHLASARASPHTAAAHRAHSLAPAKNFPPSTSTPVRYQRCAFSQLSPHDRRNMFETAVQPGDNATRQRSPPRRPQPSRLCKQRDIEPASPGTCSNNQPAYFSTRLNYSEPPSPACCSLCD